MNRAPTRLRSLPDPSGLIGVAGPIAAIMGVVALNLVLPGERGMLAVLAAGLGVAVAAISMQRPQVAVVAALGVGAFTREVVAFGITVDVATAWLVLLALPLWRSWRLRDIALPIRIGAGLFLLGLAVSLTRAVDPVVATWDGLVRWALVVNWGFALYATCRNGTGRTTLLYAYAAAAIGGVVAVIGALQLRGINLPLVGPPWAPGLPDATLGYYSNYANFIAVTSVVTAAALLDRRTLRSAVLMMPLLISLTIQVVQIGTAASRGGILLAAVAALYLVVMSFGSIKRLLGRLIAIAIAVYIGFNLLASDVQARLIARFETVQGGDVVRDSLQAAGQRLAEQSPMGVGWGNFDVLTQTGVVQGVLQTLAHAHNLFTQTALDAGWVGFAGFLLMIAAALTAGTKASFGRHEAPLQPYFAAALVGFLAQGWNDYFFFETGSMLIFAFALFGSALPPRAVEATLPTTATDRSLPAAAVVADLRD